MTIFWPYFGRPAPPETAAGQKFLAPRYYSQRAVFASLRALFSSSVVVVIARQQA